MDNVLRVPFQSPVPEESEARKAPEKKKRRRESIGHGGYTIGTLFQKGGNWWARIVYDATGESVRKSSGLEATGKNWKLAVAEFKRQIDVMEGKKAGAVPKTFSAATEDFVKYFERSVLTEGKSKNTLAGYKSGLRVLATVSVGKRLLGDFQVAKIGKTEIEQIRQSQVLTYKDDGTPREPNSKEQLMKTLRGLLKFCEGKYLQECPEVKVAFKGSKSEG